LLGTAESEPGVPHGFVRMKAACDQIGGVLIEVETQLSFESVVKVFATPEAM